MFPVRRRKHSPLFLIIAFAVLTTACGWFSQTVESTTAAQKLNTSVPVEESTATVKPTRIVIQTTPTPRVGPPPTSVQGPVSETLADCDCIRWDEVDHSYVGEIVCVYGVIASIQNIGIDQYTYFSDKVDATSPDFRLRAIEAAYYGLKEGECISIEGVVRSNGDSSFVFINPASLSQEGEVYSYDDLALCD